MKLEQKHIAPYLPYKLMMMTPKHRFNYGDQECLLLTGISNNLNEDIYEFLRYDDLEFSNTMKWVKPIFHPMSDLSKEIEVSGNKFRPIEVIQKDNDTYYISINCDGNILFKRKNEQYTWNVDIYNVYQLLFTWHFDVFHLIDKGLAIDINETL